MNDNYTVIDNFLEKKDFTEIQNIFLGDNFPWYTIENVAFEKEKDPLKFYFIHNLYRDYVPISDHITTISPILNKIKAKSLIRIKANLYPNQNKFEEHAKHIDYDFDHKGAIFYINNNNGHTVLEDGTKIKSIENRMLFFSPHKMHCSTNCTDKKYRVNINFNYF